MEHKASEKLLGNIHPEKTSEDILLPAERKTTKEKSGPLSFTAQQGSMDPLSLSEIICS